MRKTKFRQVKFRIQNIEKYKGNSTNIIYRSSWEKRVMSFFDTSSNVKWWNSEGLIVPYFNPLTKRVHNYFPDFVYMSNSDNAYMIEIKPYRETQPPSKND